MGSAPSHKSRKARRAGINESDLWKELLEKSLK